MIVIISLLVGGLIWFFGKDNVLTTGYTAILILSNIYGMSVLVLLLAHGLIKLPIHLWKLADNQYNLINTLNKADQVRKEYRRALVEYHE